MNIIKILWKIGYDVIGLDSERGEYKVTFSSERKRRTWEQIRLGKTSVENELLDDVYVLQVNEVSFNKSGDLFVEFTDVYTNECIDCYEHNNMAPHELYD